MCYLALQQCHCCVLGPSLHSSAFKIHSGEQSIPTHKGCNGQRTSSLQSHPKTIVGLLKESNPAKRVTWPNPHFARATWRCNHKCCLKDSALAETRLLRTVLSKPDEFKWKMPMAHIIPCDLDHVTWGNSCLTGGGCFSLNLMFWWCVDWPGDIQQLTLKFLNTEENTRKWKDSFAFQRPIDINILEFAVMLVNCAATCLAMSLLPKSQTPACPVLLNWADDTCFSKNMDQKSSTTFIGSRSTHSNFGTACECINTKENKTANGISHVHVKNSKFDLNKLKQEFPQLAHCCRFHISCSLLSEILSALCMGKAEAITANMMLGHFTPAENSSANGCQIIS